LAFTGSHPENDAEFFISGWWWMRGGVGGLFPSDVSGRCIFAAPPFQVFCFLFNGAPTERNYLQLFFGGTADFFALGYRVLGKWLRGDAPFAS
jgi:hypothetical protein